MKGIAIKKEGEGKLGSFVDMHGWVVGEWKIISYNGSGYWNCRCSCGKVKRVNGNTLRNGKSNSCGHTSEKVFINLCGKRFGDWKVLSYAGNGKFTCIKLGKPNYVLADMSTNEVLTPDQTTQHKLTVLELGTQEESEESIMTRLGYLKIYDSGNLEFIWKAPRI